MITMTAQPQINIIKKSTTMPVHTIVLLLTAFATALISGLLYSYSCSVIPGLGKLPDREYLMSVQSINREILNPVFFASFMGTLLLLPVSTWLYFRTPGSQSHGILLMACIVYAAGVFGVTMGGNVPLNNALDTFNIQSASPEQIIGQRQRFEQSWNTLHQVRTICSVVCLLLVLYALSKGSTIKN
jgi:uncharacterized membrane protein